MSAHLAGTSAALLLSAGVFAFAKTRSVPSLLGASALSVLFASSAVLHEISDRHALAHSLGLAAGAASLGIGLRRFPGATRKFAPALLICVGAVNLPYQGYKLYEWTR